jgi:hypothetical protein
VFLGAASVWGLLTTTLNFRLRWVSISCSCASTSSNSVKILFNPGAESSDAARLTGRSSVFKFGNCGLTKGIMGTPVCVDSDFLFAGTNPVGEAVMGLSRSGDDAVFVGLLSDTAAFDLGSCLPPVVRMEEPSSKRLEGTLFGSVMFADAVRLAALRNGRETEE